MDRNRFETLLEREVYKFVSLIKEHMFDYTMIYLNRNNIDMDRQQAEMVLKIAQAAIEDGFLSKLDFFKKDMEQVLTEWTDEKNPLALGKRRNKDNS